MSETGFDDVLFPFPIALGASGGPEWRTDVVMLSSGAEVRNARWAHSRRRWDVGGTMSTAADVRALSNFFEARQGRLRGFRLYDPFEHSSAAEGDSVEPFDQSIGTGDGSATAFQLSTMLGAGQKPVTKPKAGTVRIGVNGGELTEGWMVDVLTGQVTFDSAPGEGAVITAGFQFDWPVRFDTDVLDISFEMIGAGRAVSLPIVELV